MFPLSIIFCTPFLPVPMQGRKSMMIVFFFKSLCLSINVMHHLWSSGDSLKDPQRDHKMPFRNLFQLNSTKKSPLIKSLIFPANIRSFSSAQSSRPNILIIVADQLNGTLFPDGGPAAWLHTPHLKALAERSVRFSNAYVASPLCAPSR